MADIDYFLLISERYTSTNSNLMLASMVCNVVGFLQYFYCVHALVKKEKPPLPIWMHTFYLAHDSYWCYALGVAAPQYNNHWYLSGMSKGLFVWSFLEIWSIYKTVKDHKKEIFGPLLGPNLSLSSIYTYIFMQLMAMYGVIFLGLILMGEKSVMQWFGLTNVLMAIGPTHEYLRRGTWKTFPMGFVILNVIGITWTFAPFGQWALAFPEIYDRPEYYGIGVVLFLYSIWCCVQVAKYPPTLKVVAHSYYK